MIEDDDNHDHEHDNDDNEDDGNDEVYPISCSSSVGLLVCTFAAYCVVAATDFDL